MGTTSFTQLNVWQKAHQMALEVYRLTKKFPDDERFGLMAQMRKAAVSVPANIAEGYGRQKRQDKARFYNISQASTEEMKYYVILSRDLRYIGSGDALWKLLEEISRMLRRLAWSTLDS